MKILIVEDDRSYRALLFEFLTTGGHDVLAVSDALHAVALLSEQGHGVDLVLLDLKMPRMSGDELMNSFAHWSTCTTRFFIVSGGDNIGDYAGHPRLAGSLRKPFALTELDAALKAVVSASGAACATKTARSPVS
ncbi:MAG: response regulator transcription factor [Burkholderiales bacterium]|nr:response regulator transcription factor [Opitutaceae bacterium]